MASSSKKKKLDQKNRQFNKEWTEMFVFILHREKATCLICQTQIAVLKKANVKRHYDTHHTFHINYPLNSALRREKITKLTSALEQQVGKFITNWRKYTHAHKFFFFDSFSLLVAFLGFYLTEVHYCSREGNTCKHCSM